MTDNHGKIVRDFMNEIQSMFGKDILIIICKAKKFNKAETFKYMDLSIYYDLLGYFSTSKKNPLKPIIRDNYLACDLYFQASYHNAHMEKVIATFYNYIVKKHKNLSDLSLDSLRLIFNIIEFEHEHRICSPDEIKDILKTLLLFETQAKSPEMNILYRYYKGLLYLFLKEYNKCHLESNEINSLLIQFNQSDLIRYIGARNILLNLELSRQAPSFNINEYCTLAYILFNRLKKMYKMLAVKTGITIFEVYQKKYQMQNCISILKEMLSLIKEEMYTGSTFENGMDYYLAIALRLAYCYTMTLDKNSLLSSIKKIEKTFECINNESPQKIAIEFMLLLYKYISKTNVLTKEKSNEVITKFKKCFLDDNEHNELFKMYFPIEEEAYVDIFAINSVDVLSSSKVRNIINEYSQKIENSMNNIDNNFISFNKISSYLFALYNIISGYSLSLLNDSSEINQRKYKDNIKKNCEVLLMYLKTMFDVNPFLQVELVKDLIVKIYFCYLNCLDNKRDLEEKMNYFDNVLVKILEIEVKNLEESIEGMGYMLKFKGDLLFKEKQYQNAIDMYQKSIRCFGSGNNARVGVNLCNIGLCYLFIESRQEAIRFLNLSLNKFNGLVKMYSDNVNIPDGLNRLNMANFIDEKIKILNQILEMINA